MSRSIGDFPLKLNRKVDYRIYNKNEFYFVTIGSDGLYDVID